MHWIAQDKNGYFKMGLFPTVKSVLTIYYLPSNNFSTLKQYSL